MSQDRGYGHGPWLACLSARRLRFVVRWKQGTTLLDATGQERKAWDTHCRLSRSTPVLALPVSHPEHRGQFWVVVLRQGQGREPWYLLTNAPVETAEQAWEITISSVRRCKIEDSFRFQTTELLIESLRLHEWEPPRKMLLLVTLASGYLLSFLDPCLVQARCQLLVHWSPRADWRLWTTKVPL